jgi:thiol-disulfide isomerase/thioredoxin
MSAPRIRRRSVVAVTLGLAWLGAGRPALAAGITEVQPVADKPGQPAAEDTTPPPGIDLAKLDEFERKVFFRVVNREASACGRAHSLIYSAKHDPSCRASFYAVRYVAHLVDSGFTDSEVSEKLDKRFRTPRVSHFDLVAAPWKGAQGARVTVVEFVDYECPHCKHAQSLMKQLLEEYPSDVKVYFKHFPLSSHTNARLAAEGAVAAHRQGKFWPFNEKVWANSESLSPAVLEKAAKEVGLDVAAWRKEAASDGVKDRVQKDRSEGNDLGINATPTLYINGRKYGDPLDLASLKDWLEEELGR